MSREVCGICWCPYDEDTGECACAPVQPRGAMNREEIIRMARETDLVPSWMQNIPEHQLKWIEDFAALVAAAERERLKQSIRHSLTIGPKTIQTRVYFGEVEVSMVKMPIEEVVAVEREACADMVEDMDVQHPKYIAAAIRARGKK